MSPAQIEDLAYRGEEMPQGLNLAQQMLFQAFRQLYAYAKLTHMPKDQGKREKARLLREFRNRQAQMDHMEKTWAMWRQIEAAGSRFAKERTVEAAEDFYRAVYGCRPKKERTT